MQMKQILAYTLKDITSFGYRELAQTSISLAKIIDMVSKRKRPQYGSTEQIIQDVLIGNESKIKQFIFSEIAKASTTILHEFEPRHLSNLIYSYGLAQLVIKFEDDGGTFFDILAKQVTSFDNLNEFLPQQLSNTVWAYATAEEQHPQLFEKVADHIVGRNNLYNFKPQELSNTVWAYATLDEQHSKLFEKVGDHIISLDNLNDFWPQALSNILWAYATNGQDNEHLFKKIADHIITLESLHDFWPQALSNIVLAYATAGEPHPQLFKNVADHIVTLPSLRMFNGQDCSNTLWAFATAKESHPMLFKKVADHVAKLDNLSHFDPQAFSNIVWSFAISEESHPQLFNKLADEAIKKQHDFASQGVANFLWAYASNGQVGKHLFSSFVPSVKANIDKYNMQNLAIITWAYSVANVNVPSVFNNEFINACLEKKDEFESEDLRQLHQWQLWQDEIKSDISLPQSLQMRCYEAFTSQDPRPSKFQDDVVSNLSSMGLQPQEEVLLKSGYQIDAVVEVDGKQIAVEVDGPSHFIGKELTGSTILKHRQVAALDGMQFVSVPYWEWNNLKKDSKKKKQYLSSLLGV